MAKKAPSKPVARKRPAKKKTPSVPHGTLSGQPASLPRLIAFVLSSLGVGIISGVLLAGGIRIGGSDGPDDAVSKAFDAYETLWREAQGELATRLESGQIKSESDATDWFGKINTEARRQAFSDILKAEAAEFGGEKWTAEKHATAIRRYVR
jgi:hypothetical protein